MRYDLNASRLGLAFLFAKIAFDIDVKAVVPLNTFGSQQPLRALALRAAAQVLRFLKENSVE